VSRIDAASRFAGICKTRKRQSLRRDGLANVLHVEHVFTKPERNATCGNWKSWMTSQTTFGKICVEAEAEVFAAALRKMPANSSSSTYPQNY
jgi:hypothetical protein